LVPLARDRAVLGPEHVPRVQRHHLLQPYRKIKPAN
jgi:hypothetical protein